MKKVAAITLILISLSLTYLIYAEVGNKKAVIKDQEVQIINEQGQIINTVSLAKETKQVTKPDNFGVSSQFILRIDKSPAVSKDGQYFVITANTFDEGYIDEQGQQIHIDEGEVTGAVYFYNVNGNKLWKKQFPEGTGIKTFPIISEHGDIIIISIEDNSGYDYTMKVFNKNGEEKVSIPASREDKYWGAVYEKSSPNGRYVAMHVIDKVNKRRCTIFYDLKNTTSWDSGNFYGVDEIADNGITGIKDLTDKPYYRNSIVDLKHYLGE